MRLAFWKKRKDGKPRKKKPVWREWLDAALFAIIAATIIRTFFIEAYTIPTGSMEGSLLVNDFLFVSKLSYGPRTPMTPVAVPLVHNTMPIFGGKSYTDAVQWKYHRLPGFGHVKRNDVVVFNFPNGDTVVAEYPDQDYYQIVREAGHDAVNSQMHIITRPVDKKENYIKRCVGVPGDKIEVRDGVLYVNDQHEEDHPHQKSTYYLRSAVGLSEQFVEDNNIELIGQRGNEYYVFLENKYVDAVSKTQGITLVPDVMPKGTIAPQPKDWTFPQDTTNFRWNLDNFGPLEIPKKGGTVVLTPQNMALYRRIITNYEGNKLEESNGQYRINGQPATSYTFRQDYFWMMGDNRHNSLDSRYWGFVPEDHVVGKAWFVWLSYGKGGIRWSRLFRSIRTLEK